MMQSKSTANAIVLFAFLVTSLPAILHAQAPPITAAEAHSRAEELLKQMTIEEKVGQMNQSSGVVMPLLADEKPDNLIIQGKVGSILWLIDVKEINRLQHLAVEKSRLHIPILFAFDVIHGYRTVFPIPLAMAASWDPGVEEAAQRLAGQDARAAGIRWTFTPMVDIARDSRWGRIVEGAGEDPYLGAAMARAQVVGFQGESLGPDSVVACVKHFAGYGAADGGRDYDSSYVPEELMRNVYLVPFHAAEQAGAGSFMSAYMDLNDVPATGNHWLLTDILRNEWGFKGFVVSDAWAVGAPANPRLRQGPRRRCLQSRHCRSRHGHGQPHLPEISRQARARRQSAGVPARRGRPADPRRSSTSSASSTIPTSTNRRWTRR